MPTDKITLLNIGTGPEGFEFYTSENESAIDHADDVPALYLTACVNGAFVKMGPFHPRIRQELEELLKLRSR